MAICLLLGLLNVRVRRSEVSEDLTNRARLLAKYLAEAAVDPLLMGRLDRLQSTVETAKGADSDVIRVDVFASDMSVAASTDRSARSRAVDSAFATGAMWGREMVSRETDDPDVFELATPVRFEKRGLGVVQLRVSRLRLNQQMRRVWRSTAAAGLIAVALGTVLYGAAARRVAQSNAVLLEEIHRFGLGMEATVAERTRELAEANASLRSLDVAKTEFLSVASHELKNPIASIHGFSRTLKRLLGPAAPEKHVHYLDVMSSECERLARLLDDLLDVAKIELGYYELRPAPTKMLPLVRKVAEALNIHKPGITMAVEFEDPELVLHVDADKVEQVLMNLGGNGVKYSPAGGRLRFGARRENGHVVFSIEDQGPGIPKEHQAKLFQKFYRVENSTGGAGPKGTGLGLTIAKKIVEAHGGRIWVESETGRGTSSKFSLPAA